MINFFWILSSFHCLCWFTVYEKKSEMRYFWLFCKARVCFGEYTCSQCMSSEYFFHSHFSYGFFVFCFQIEYMQLFAFQKQKFSPFIYSFCFPAHFLYYYCCCSFFSRCVHAHIYITNVSVYIYVIAYLH